MERTHESNYLVTSTGFGGGDGGRGHDSSNCTSSLAWDIWHLGSTSSSSPSSSRRYHPYHDWSTNTHNPFPAAGAPPSNLVPDRSGAYKESALVCQVPNSPRPGLFYGDPGAAGIHHKAAPDPRLMCLKLGKRYYFEDGNLSIGICASTFPRQLNSDHYDRYMEEAAAAADISMNSKKGKLVVFPYDACGGPNYIVGGTTTVAVPAVPRCQVQGCEAMLSKGKEYHRRHKVCENALKGSQCYGSRPSTTLLSTV